MVVKPRKQYIEKKCIVCNNAFSVIPSKINKKFCNQDCYHKYSSLNFKGHWYNKKLSEQHKKNIGLGGIGRIQTIEARLKLSASKKGIPRNEETKRKISNSLKGQISWQKILGEKHPKIMGWKKKLHDKNYKMKEKKCEMCESFFLPYNGKKHRMCSMKCVNKHVSNIKKGIARSQEIKQKISLSLKGKSSWNKGLTKETSEGIKKGSEKYKKWRATKIFPTQDTNIEIKMQNELRNRGIVFEKHKMVLPSQHYRCDLFIEPNIIIECDGDYWHHYPKGNEKDKVRNKEMQEKGFKVLRYWEHEIKDNVIGCVDEIEDVLCLTDNKEVYEVH